MMVLFIFTQWRHSNASIDMVEIMMSPHHMYTDCHGSVLELCIHCSHRCCHTWRMKWWSFLKRECLSVTSTQIASVITRNRINVADHLTQTISNLISSALYTKIRHILAEDFIAAKSLICTFNGVTYLCL